MSPRTTLLEFRKKIGFMVWLANIEIAKGFAQSPFPDHGPLPPARWYVPVDDSPL